MTVKCKIIIIIIIIIIMTGTHEALAPDTAMLKPFFANKPCPVEKPWTDGLNFLRMSEIQNTNK